MRRLHFLLPALVLLAGCGGSSRSSPASRSSASGASSSAGSATATAPNAPTMKPAHRPSARSAPGATSRSGPPAGSGGAINARVPASFSLTAGGKLSPGSVSAPAFLAVAFSISSSDSSSHQVVLRTPAPRSLTVPAHGRAGTMLAGLKAGTYPVDVDGRERGVLLIGGEPGP